ELKSLCSDGRYLLHPAILDCCLQILAYKQFHGNFNPNAYYLPSKIRKIVVHREMKVGYFPHHLYAYVKFCDWRKDMMRFDIILADDTGERLCTLSGVEVAKHIL
ncbi:hypothetical protein M422DRAFT_92362, partial [Sphaerobolus stellatus SS14]